MSTHFQIANLPEPLVDYRLSATSLNTVLKKSEYEAANEQNVLRNIRYYMGEDVHISRASLECLRHNFRPLLTHYNLQTALESLALMDEITEKILQKENVNRDVKSIRRARYFKRKFILNELGNGLPLMQSLELLIRTRAWLSLITILKNFFKWYLKQKIKIFRNYRNGAFVKIFNSQPVKNS
jgi:hypothetical protein